MRAARAAVPFALAATSMLTFLAMTTMPRTAHAQQDPGSGSGSGSGSDPALAETLFQKGRELMKQGSLAEACSAFAESHKLDPKAGTLANLATCHEKRGATASAWAEFTLVAQQASRLGQTEREQFAREHIKELEGRLSRVTVNAQRPTAPEMKVRLGDRDIPPGALGTTFPVDPGTYDLVVSAPGRSPYSTRIVVPDGPASQGIEIPILAMAPVEPPKDNANKNPDPSTPPPKTSSLRKAAPWITGSIAVIGLGVGGFFGLETFAKKEDGDALCPGGGRLCPQSGLDRHAEAEQAATISTVAFSVALVAAGITVVLIATSSSAPRARARASNNTASILSW